MGFGKDHLPEIDSEGFERLLVSFSYWRFKPEEWERGLARIGGFGCSRVVVFLPWTQYESDITQSLQKFCEAAWNHKLQVCVVMTSEPACAYPKSGVPTDLLTTGRTLTGPIESFATPDVQSKEFAKRYLNFLNRFDRDLAMFFKDREAWFADRQKLQLWFGNSFSSALDTSEFSLRRRAREIFLKRAPLFLTENVAFEAVDLPWDSSSSGTNMAAPKMRRLYTDQSEELPTYQVIAEHGFSLDLTLAEKQATLFSVLATQLASPERGVVVPYDFFRAMGQKTLFHLFAVARLGEVSPKSYAREILWITSQEEFALESMKALAQSPHLSFLVGRHIPSNLAYRETNLLWVDSELQLSEADCVEIEAFLERGGSILSLGDLKWTHAGKKRFARLLERVDWSNQMQLKMGIEFDTIPILNGKWIIGNLNRDTLFRLPFEELCEFFCSLTRLSDRGEYPIYRQTHFLTAVELKISRRESALFLINPSGSSVKGMIEFNHPLQLGELFGDSANHPDSPLTQSIEIEIPAHGIFSLKLHGQPETSATAPRRGGAKERPLDDSRFNSALPTF